MKRSTCWECGEPTARPGPPLLVSMADGVLGVGPSFHCEACASTWPGRLRERRALLRAWRRLGYPPRASELIGDDFDEPLDLEQAA